MPLIDYLRSAGIEVILGGEGRSLQLLKETYPDLETITLPSYNIHYAAGKSQVWAMLRQWPGLRRTVQKEHQVLQKLVQTHQLQAVISDNRYGLWSDVIPSVFICHQLALMVPKWMAWFRSGLYQFHLKYMRKFTRIWIPDYPGEVNLSASLSHQYALPPNASFIGPLSRFASLHHISDTFDDPLLREDKPDIVAILSGPEPQRTLLENELVRQARTIDRSFWIIQGKTEAITREKSGNIRRISFLNAPDLFRLLKLARVIISRPGYSSLMDYAAMGASHLILIPTPGQTEQEYLASLLAEKGLALVYPQHSLSLGHALSRISRVKKYPQWGDYTLFHQPLDAFLTHLHKTLD